MHSLWYGRLAAVVREKRSEAVDYLVGGGAGDTNIAAYTKQVGFIMGLDEALRLAEELDKQG